MNSQPIPDNKPRPGLFKKVGKSVMNLVMGYDDNDDMEGQIHPEEAARRPSQTIRLHASTTSRVAVRRNPRSLNDARNIADGLKMGEQQIVNLEMADQNEVQKVIDFLSGVCYALDGTAECVGKRVYLFAPANVELALEDTPPAGQPYQGFDSTRD